jgi:hypothetical protein
VGKKLPDSWIEDDLPPLGPFIAFKYGTILDDIEHEAFRRCGIKKMTLPSTLLFPERPETSMDIVDFRENITRRSTPGPLKDNAWRHIANLVRTRNEHWLLWALFTAKPKLGSVGYDITNGRPALVRRIRQTALVVEFGAAMLRLSLDEAFLFNRLVDTASTQATGRKRKTSTRPPEVSYEVLAESQRELHSRIGIPDEDTEYDLLEWLVLQINERDGGGRITVRQEALIRRTFLDHMPLKEVADDFGMSEASASKMRRRGTDRLALYLNRRDLVEADESTPQHNTRDRRSKKAASDETQAAPTSAAGEEFTGDETGGGEELSAFGDDEDDYESE